ncbi:hypothetical protein PWP92_05295 [Enterobacter hormaechei subsp. xiangfangensis]|uniref:hypothetical protein n=1 Tax=Enterobacter hormaechei TaxID=158836 RepID=UPI001950686F|nr:hypothetical protein [Enterobacter hormaechei]MDE4073732.1 hypothetical protein [Enterobacter hormaechei subsp. xiangfangensis]
MNVKRYEWMAFDEHACHCDAVESAEGDMVDYEDYAALEARCAAMAAENAGLKAALRPSDIPSEWTDAFGDTAVIEHDSTGDNQGHSVSWSWVGNQEEVIKSVLLAVDKGIETPATDAFLAEVRAQESKRVYESILDNPAVTDMESLVDWLEQNANDSSAFAAQLRKGVQS